MSEAKETTTSSSIQANENAASSSSQRAVAANTQNLSTAPTIPAGPPMRGGVPFVVYDSREFQDRSESTWAYCSHCNLIGMTVIKLQFSFRAFCAGPCSNHQVHERVHYCPFCSAELGRRYNAKNCCA